MKYIALPRGTLGHVQCVDRMTCDSGGVGLRPHCHVFRAWNVRYIFFYLLVSLAVVFTDVKVLGAIRKFHLADHVDSCFSKWTLNFMKGAGHIDGEIMETLWSGMNKVSGAARSMSKAHRQETLDDYMRDANWKKTVGIGKFLFQKIFKT